MNGIAESTRNFHYQWLERSIERMEERKQRGDNTVEMQTGELQRILMELLSMHLRCDRLETMLAEFAGLYQRLPLKEKS
jgi:hypothetical protein